MLFKSHFLAVGIGYISVKFHYVEQWLVILVNQDHSLTSRLLVGSTEDITEAYGVIVNNRCYIILFSAVTTKSSMFCSKAPFCV